MKNELYKLILVFIMIAISFSLAFFLGREVTLSNQKIENSKPNPLFIELEKEKPFILKDLDDSLKTKKDSKNTIDSKDSKFTNTQRQIVDKYKTIILSKKLQNTAELKKTVILYGLLIAKYSDKEKASLESIKLKVRFPKWRIFFIESKEVYKVYIGPFKIKSSAKQFLKILQKVDFKSAKLEILDNISYPHQIK